jgi:hypothetical protein
VKWLKHAFAIDSEGPAQPNEAQHDLIERLCAAVVRRRMATPVLLFLEMHRPFHYLSGQVLHFLQPLVAGLANTDGYGEFTRFLEQRGSIDYLVARLEALEKIGRPAHTKKSS